MRCSVLDGPIKAHMEYMTSIVRNEARDKNGNPPALSDRVAAGGCMMAVYTIIENGFDLDVEKSIAECEKVYGSKWPGPEAE